MIKLEHTMTGGWDAAIRGMRNPMNSWDKSDSVFTPHNIGGCILGKNDLGLMRKLAKLGSDHRKYMRMITVYVNITAPLYWWKEFDTYKVGTVANSCSTMHKLTSKPIELSDFSIDDCVVSNKRMNISLEDLFHTVVGMCEILRKKSVETGDKQMWKALIQLLPCGYNQMRTVMLNYEVLRNMYHARKNHKLDEWREFCKWIETLPYSELITGGKENETISEPD